MDHATPTFEEWLANAFEGVPWEREGLFETDGAPTCVLIATYLVRLFESPGLLMELYTGDQLRNGFWFICGIESGCFWSARERHVPVELQIRWMDSLGDLYEKLFAPVCSGHLSHLDEGPSHPLNSPVYMLWDTGALEGAAMFPDDLQSHHLIEPIFRLLERAISLPSIACQESALHGLGHLAHCHPDRVKGIVGRFLHESSGLRPELRTYADTQWSATFNRERSRP